MKGLLKGLRYISQIFDAKEEEMQIGYPTDVKHVAHIGWDGPSVNPPTWVGNSYICSFFKCPISKFLSFTRFVSIRLCGRPSEAKSNGLRFSTSQMNDFRSAPLSALGAEALGDQSQPRLPSNDTNVTAGETPQSPLRELPDQQVPKPRRQSSASSAMVADSPTRSPGVPRHSRRNKSATSMPIDPSMAEQTSSRRHAASLGGGNSVISTPTDSPARDLPAIPKVARKKKTKAGSGVAGGGSSRSGRPSAQAPLSEGGEIIDRNGENSLAITSSPEVRAEV
ncbi:hypothetical protein Taro_055266 [Colocasia esculenta]|uniref:CRIB domain-containing protein n=1 Tax=Colocasia esculenta TaxID=4460 RepID=A0A843XSF2_COLES|nr:hypothetical protein [Colocasia esculenta]